MLPRADLNVIRPVAYVEAALPVGASGEARQEVFNRLNQLNLGQQLLAKVLDRQPDGTFTVRLADTTARMALPEGTKPGDTLAMTLLARQPRPTFVLGQEAAPAGGARTTLSSAGRLIDQLLQTAQQSGASKAALGTAPMLPAAANNPAALSAALHNALSMSGLFYESHLAEWAEGKRPLSSLRQEPQGQTPTNLAQQSANGLADTALLRHLAQRWTESGRPIAELAQQIEARTGNAQAMLSLLNEADGMAQQTAQTAQILNAQLNALETQRFMWQGELWPGQQMSWEVSRNDGNRGNTAEQGQAGQEEQQENWQSVVKFELPNLGQVAATIHLHGDRVSILVRTESSDSAQLLRARGGELALALDVAGSPLDALIVNDDE